MRALSEKTRIPLGLAVIAIGGGAWWLSSFYSQVQSMSSKQADFEAYVRAELSEMKKDVKCLLRKSSRVAANCPSINPGPYAGR